jgi:hypothetical protein
MAGYSVEWTSTGSSICNYVSSKILDKGIIRKYASSQEKNKINNMVLNNVVPKTIQNNKGKTFLFSNVPIYNVNPIADSNISTWELHSDDGSGHFIVKVYRELGYIELDVIEELNFLC